MNKKANSIAIIVCIIILVIIILGAIIGLIIANEKGLFGKREKPIETLSLYIKARDITSQISIDANYAILLNQSIFSEGSLKKDQWTETKIPKGSMPVIHCWNNDHYLVKVIKQIQEEEAKTNKSTLVCDLIKIGNLTVSHQGDLSRELNTISLKIKTDDWFYKVGICVSWTAGIIDVFLPDQIINCSSANWTNYSLAQDAYSCGETLEKCEYVEGKICKLKSMEIPTNYKNKVDSCFYIGKSLHNETLSVPFTVKTLAIKNSLDKIDFYIIDFDRRYNTQTNSLEWISEFQGQDIGSENVQYTIHYQN